MAICALPCRSERLASLEQVRAQRHAGCRVRAEQATKVTNAKEAP